MGMALLTLGGLAWLACWVIVLIKMFQTEKPLIGVLGIICGLWAFIWGWMNATKLNLKKIMMIWSIAWVLVVIGQVMAGATMASDMQKLQQQQTAP